MCNSMVFSFYLPGYGESRAKQAIKAKCATRYWAFHLARHRPEDLDSIKRVIRRHCDYALIGEYESPLGLLCVRGFLIMRDKLGYSKMEARMPVVGLTIWKTEGFARDNVGFRATGRFYWQHGSLLAGGDQCNRDDDDQDADDKNNNNRRSGSPRY